jgi:hypothetical protein
MPTGGQLSEVPELLELLDEESEPPEPEPELESEPPEPL